MSDCSAAIDSTLAINTRTSASVQESGHSAPGQAAVRATAPMLSVIVCTHSPRPDFLARTLEHLAAQTLPLDQWELVVVDNASQLPLESGLISWHPDGRLVREERLGLVWARGCGAKVAAGEVLVFVDDDNLLSPAYLASVIRLFEQRPQLGGAGARIDPEFEADPPAWLPVWRNYLALRDLGPDEIVRNKLAWGAWCPIGAGMAVRRTLFMQHWEDVLSDVRRQRFGRLGRSLASAEDADLVFGILRRGYATGYFPELRLRHIIPRERLALGYMCRLVHNICSSNVAVKRANAVKPVSSFRWRRAATEIFTASLGRGRDRLMSWLIVISAIAGEARGYLLK